MEDLELGLKMIFRKEHLDFSLLILVYQRVLKKKRREENSQFPPATLGSQLSKQAHP